MEFNSKSHYEYNRSFTLEKEPKLEIVSMFLKLDRYVEDFTCIYKSLLVYLFYATEVMVNA